MTRLGQWEDETAWQELDEWGADDGVVEESTPEWTPEWTPPTDEVIDERPPPRDDEDASRELAAYRAMERESAADVGPLVTWYEPGPAGEPVEGALDRFVAAGGSVERALASIQQARRMGDSETLRDAEHALASQYIIDTLGPVGYVAVAVNVPAYAAAKWIAQSVPGGAILAAVAPVPLTRAEGATTPSWSEVWWGLRPLWAPVGRR